MREEGLGNVADIVTKIKDRATEKNSAEPT